MSDKTPDRAASTLWLETDCARLCAESAQAAGLAAAARAEESRLRDLAARLGSTRRRDRQRLDTAPGLAQMAQQRDALRRDARTADFRLRMSIFGLALRLAARRLLQLLPWFLGFALLLAGSIWIAQNRVMVLETLRQILMPPPPPPAAQQGAGQRPPTSAQEADHAPPP
ncbi:hypothetical protein H9N28_09335 [Rhodobacter capsulatus]|uniref:hypothetical protein n=1 Tax=Rhodobacter capsulatus TaxID=1061 RepID=UPI0006DD26E7|nr:hypothetical protein [Rhodobacter capsulatus]KQB12743.1 hypothetical protein AP073_06490 [Rhodobacter capsulatus]KQB15347.1 hypothetical protein AP071_14400 [Rhodobacter capsulatus]PZX26328.1 hypothetical protein LY44_01022 [Rhodobacter capsulatus]QNR61821.1 hypothetical protein H9N28_09335 [Rhodobacter capsulatus]